jgi:apolipoprotein N-acyltransferase
VVEQSQLIIWPEGAVPDTWQRTAKAIMPLLPRRSDNSSPDYLFGAVDEPSARDKSAGQVYYNAAIAVTNIDGQRNLSLYRKVHLVPFGEFLPLRPLTGWIIDYLKIPMSNFSAWEGEQAGTMLAGSTAAINICYEDAFGEELLGAARDSDFMVNISEDAWFGDSLAPHQRLQMAQVRAREFGRYFVRAANTGITAVIDDRGVVTDRLEQFKTTVLTSDILPLEGITPYARYGNALFLVLCLLWMLPAVLVNRLHGAAKAR